MSKSRLFLFSLLAAYAWALVLSFAWQSGLVTRLAMPLLHQHESHRVQAASITLAAQKESVDYVIMGDEDFQKRVAPDGNVVRIMIAQMNLAQAQALLKASHAFPAKQMIVQNRPEYWSNGVLYGVAPNQTLWNISQDKGYRFNPWPIGDIRLLFDLIGDLATIPHTPAPTLVASYWINQEWKFDKKRKEYFAEPLANAERIIWLADQTRQPTDNQYNLAERFKSEMAQHKMIEGLGTFAAEVK